jgi:hypothetical protein
VDAKLRNDYERNKWRLFAQCLATFEKRVEPSPKRMCFSGDLNSFPPLPSVLEAVSCGVPGQGIDENL